jgi:hypothetical protein
MTDRSSGLSPYEFIHASFVTFFDVLNPINPVLDCSFHIVKCDMGFDTICLLKEGPFGRHEVVQNSARMMCRVEVSVGMTGVMISVIKRRRF